MRIVSPEVRSINLAMPCPCIGPQRNVRKMIRSRVPCMISSRSVDFCLGLIGRQPTTRRVDALPRKTFPPSEARRAGLSVTGAGLRAAQLHLSSPFVLHLGNVASDTFCDITQL